LTVPHLYPEADEFKEMPTVFATGFMVGLMEWTCMKVLESHHDEGRRVWFKVKAHDGIDPIGEGRHERIIVLWSKFVSRVNEKAKKARVSPIAPLEGTR